MSKRTTRLLSLILTLVMFLSVATPAYAWGPGDFGGGWDRDIGDDEVRDLDVEVEEAEEEYDYFQALDEENNVQVTIEAPMGSLPSLAEVRLEAIPAVDLQDAVNEIVDGSPEILVAMDISFWLGEDEIEPEEPVRVKISAPELEGKTNLQVIHFPDDAEEPETVQLIPEEDLTFALGTNEVAFQADSFSVYAVIGGPDEPSARATVNFYKTKGDTTPIATVYVKETDTADEVDQIVYDPGVPELTGNTIFQGWCRLDGENDQVTLDTEKLSIEKVREQILAMNITEDVTVNYYAVIYKYFNVSYYADGLCYGSESVMLLLEDEQVQYKVSMLYTAGTEQDFKGWKAADGVDHIVSATLADNNHTQLTAEQIDGNTVFPNDSIIMINGDVKFGVEAPAGHWLIFHENPDKQHSGATYIAPQFLEQNDLSKDPQAGEGGIPMKCPGYTFDGWYLGTTDGEGNFTGFTTKYTFGQTVPSTTHLYAKWIDATSAFYTVIIWKENLDGDGWDFAESRQITGQSPGASITYNQNSWSMEGFEFKETDIGTGENAKKVKADSSTIVNVYYQRKTYTLTFNDPGSNYISYVYNSTAYADATVSNSAVTNTNTINTLESTSRKKTINGYEVSYTGNYNATYYIKKADGKWYQISNYGQYVYNASEINALPRSSGSKVIEAKYGANIANEFPITCSNGVTYDHGERWNPQNDSIWKEVMVIIDQMPSRNVTFTLDLGQQKKDITMYYYVEALSTDTNTRTYGGVKYVLYTANPVKAKYNGVTEEDYIELSGFSKKAVANENDVALSPISVNNSAAFYRVNSSSDAATNVYFYYSRDKYTIEYMDGSYFGGKNGTTPMTVVQPDKDLGTSSEVFFNADISAYGNKNNTTSDPKVEGYFTPASKVDGYIFAGWYVDDSCSQEVTFDKMPLQGTHVYAKWVQVRYRVFLHPNAGRDNTLDWGSADQEMNFGVAWGDKISAPFGTRDGYVFLGWTRKDGSAFNSDFIALTDSTVPADPVYNKSTDFTDPMDRFGDITGTGTNSDAERFWVIRKLDLYGKWRKVTPGADGVGVVYDLNGGTGKVEDTSLYPDNTDAAAQTAPATAPNAADGSEQHFLYWVVQKWDSEQEKYVDAVGEDGNPIHVSPGGNFTVLVDNAKKEPKYRTDDEGNVITDPETGEPIQETKTDEHGNPILQWIYTVQLRAEYGPLDTPTPTHITWYSNVYDNMGAEIPDEKIDQLVRKAPSSSTEEPYTAVDFVEFKGYGYDRQSVQINKGVNIPAADTYTLPGYVFLGWGRVDNENKLTRDYYLCGWINDAAYGNEGDAANIGIYKIPKDTGKLKVTFTANTWVGVKTGDNAEWYWGPSTAGGITATTGLLYKAPGNDQKMHIPEGVQVTITLKELIGDNGDVYGVELSYTTASASTSSGTAALRGESGIKDPKDLTEENLFLKWDSENEVYLAKNDSGEWVEVTQVACDEKQPYNDLYAVWGNAFYVYHSGVADGAVETVPLTRANATYDLTQHLGGAGLNRAGETPKVLYGGYYTVKDGSDFAPPAKVDGVIPAYDGTNWTWVNGETTNGMKMNPQAGVTYYVKEVPAEMYLQPYFHYTYQKALNAGDPEPIKTAWLISDIDDYQYRQTGFAIIDENNEAKVCSALTVQNKVGGASVVLKPETIFRAKGVTKGYLSYLEVITDGAPTLMQAGNQVVQYWVTPDNLIVTGIAARTYSGLDLKTNLTKTDQAVESIIAEFSATPAAEP